MNFLNDRKRVGVMRNLPAFFIILLLMLPVLFLILRLDFGFNENWIHFKTYLLGDAASNTALLVIGTVLTSGTIGVLLAYGVTVYDFPFRRAIRWLLYLPLTIPPYIAAYVYSGMTSYTGVIQTTLRGWGIILEPGSMSISSIKGAVFIYTITLYPYVYGIVRSFLENHSAGFIETARLHGFKAWRILFKVIFPLVRIPLIGGATLVIMEVTSDYGVVKYFGIRTLSSSIFSLWFGMGDSGVAVRLSFYIMVAIIVFLALEDLFRGGRRYGVSGMQPRRIEPVLLKGFKGKALSTMMISFLLISFIVPVLQMIYWATMAYEKVRLDNLSVIAFDSLFYSLLAAAIIILISVALCHLQRWLNPNFKKVVGKLTQTGYAVPGAIIAIGTIMAFVSIDSTLYPLYKWIDPSTKKLVLSTSTIMLLFAFVIRYMSIGYNTVNSGFSKIGTGFNDAARIMGKTPRRALLQVEIPMMLNSLASGFLLVFIDIMKELPLTLLLRPFNFNTLASRAYEYANDERILESSIPSLLIIGICMVSIAVFVAINRKSRKGDKFDVEN